jgi:hypothetical protein
MVKFANTPVGRLSEWAFHYHQRGYPAAGPDRDGIPAPLSLIHVIWVEGRMVTLHLSDLLEVLSEVVGPETARQSRIKWPPRPLTPHTYVRADINKGIDLPCCDLDEDHPVHHGGPPPHAWEGVGACGEPMTCQFRWEHPEGGTGHCTAPPGDKIHEAMT